MYEWPRQKFINFVSTHSKGTMNDRIYVWMDEGINEQITTEKIGNEIVLWKWGDMKREKCRKGILMLLNYGIYIKSVTYAFE